MENLNEDIMNNLEIEQKINRIYDVVIRMEPLVQSHNIAINGNGKAGLKEEITIIKQKYDDCPARLAYTPEVKNFYIAYTMMVVGILSATASVIFGILNYLR
jgi:hypothetical protein